MAPLMLWHVVRHSIHHGITCRGLPFLFPLSKSSESQWRWSSSTSPNSSKSKIYTIDEVKETISSMIGTQKEWGSDKIIPKQGVMQKIVMSQDELKPRHPSDSYCQAVIPLGTDSVVRDRYLTFRRIIRFGRLLEAFDAMAVLICYKHNLDPSLGPDQKSPFIFVTALVDRISIDPKKMIDPMKDIYVDGNITWVGRSSMECTMHISQDKDNSRHQLITAYYLFVGRNPMTNRAAIVSPLVPQTKLEKELFKKGQESKARRIAEGKWSLLKVPPSEPERNLVHDVFLSTVDIKGGSLVSKEALPNCVWMKDTILKTLHLCQPEERNLYNKMFGGFLMRTAFELAWINASIHSKVIHPMCKTIEDIRFRMPVEIGSLLFLSSQVVYVNGSDVQVKVHAAVVDPVTGEHSSTNDFHFTFDTGLSTLPNVLPKSYAEAMLYLDGMRHYNK